MLDKAGTPPTAQELADRVAVQEILALHSRGLDRLDSALLQTCYWADAEVNYGTFVGSAHQFAELVMQALSGQYELTRHCISNTIIAFTAEGSAKTESMVDAAHLFHAAKVTEGTRSEMQFSGRYLDALEKRDGVWKIQHRHVVMDWSRVVSLTDERNSEAFATMSKGGHREEDPSHAFFLK